MRLRAITVPAFLLLAGACARPPKAELDAKRTLDALRESKPEIPAGDLAVALTSLAWKDHPDLDEAKAQLEAAKAGIRTAKAIPNPSFGFSATKAEGVPRPWTLTYGLTFPIELGGKRSLRVKQARLQVEVAELAVADTAWKLRTGVRAALTDWQQAREASLAADREASLRGELLKLQDRRYALGEIGAPERAASALESQRAEAARLVARTDLSHAASAVALAAGLPLPALQARLDAEPPPDLAPPAAPPPQEMESLIHRLDVRRVLLAWDQNETALDQELAQRVPNLQIGPGYSFDQGVKKWSLGLSVDLPLFDRRQGPIAEAVARRGVIEAQLRQVETRALSEAALAESRYAAARDRLLAQNEAMTQQQVRLDMARRAFDLGGTDQGDLLAAELEALQARVFAVDAWAEAQRARLAMEDAFQKPLDGAEQPYAFDEVKP
ncbi:MAG TPA: TolC family protein [Holophagaceae bacterium]|nr:TolC family protein [Holophagaceae bacterium]